MNRPGEEQNVPGSAPRWRTRMVGALSVIVAGVLGIGIAEYVFAQRDAHAFPHLNLYVEDEALGVRLLPGGSQGFLLGTNPRSDIRVNQDGYRGADWGPPTHNEVLVVGDSQVFGLGVEEHQTFSAQLEALLKRKVLNGGVPTYGPAEYTAVVGEVLQSRPVTDVVYVINMVNDLFENERPNKDRHRVLDGWAVRTETMPSIVDFPGRTALFRQSHLLYAWRRLSAPKTGAVRTASEGSARDLLGRIPDLLVEQSKKDARAKQAADALAKADALVKAERAVVKRADATYIDLPPDLYELVNDLPGAESGAASGVIAASFAGAGDIVQDHYAEASRPVVVTARDIQRAAAVRRKLVKRWKRGHAQQRKLARAIGQSEKMRRETRAQWARPFDEPPLESPLFANLQKVSAVARAHGATLTVVVLPIDVQVDAAEWEKYGEPPQDLRGTEVFTTEILKSSRRVGARAFPLMTALREAEPGAFLDGDIHLTPKGHRAVAHAIADNMERRVPTPVPPRLAWRLPEGRTVVPTTSEWLGEREIIVKGTSAAHCGTWQIDEWFRITCTPRDRTAPYKDALVDIADINAPRHETLSYHAPSAATLVAALLPGESLTATIRWATKSQNLRVSADAQGKITGALGDETAAKNERSAESYHLDQTACRNRSGAPPPAARAARAARFPGLVRLNKPVDEKECALTVLNATRPECTHNDQRNERTCSEAHVDGMRPRCAPGQVLALGTARCVSPCESDGQCSSPNTGTCTDYLGAKLCL